MTAKARMTPGPWTDSDSRWPRCVIAQHGKPGALGLVVVAGGVGPENARAIACLPELVEAAQAITGWDDAREEGEPTDCEQLDDLTQRIDALRRILARIEGGE